MLRHPVERASSHFHFMRSQTWTIDSSLQNHDLATFLRQAKDTNILKTGPISLKVDL